MDMEELARIKKGEVDDGDFLQSAEENFTITSRWCHGSTGYGERYFREEQGRKGQIKGSMLT